MKSKILDQTGEKTYAIIFETGDEVTSGLLRFAKENALGGSHFTGIGAFQDVTLGYFQWESKDYKRIVHHEQVEVLSLVGDIALAEGEPKLHAHVVVGTPDGSTLGGHLMEAHVRPTLEVILAEAPEPLQRRFDKASGLPLIRI